MEYNIVRLSEHPEYKTDMAKWFSAKWGIPESAYQESMEQCLTGDKPYPEWYVVISDENSIIAGLGVIENDFHDRKDLYPNVCAVYTEPEWRGKGIAGVLLKRVCRDMAYAGINTLYLLTPHESFYERYGWEYLCMAQGEGDTEKSRVYVHKQHAKDQ